MKLKFNITGMTCAACSARVEKVSRTVEGVETAEQSEFLEAIGCDIVQGYYYGKPMPVEDFEEELINNYEGGNVV